MLSSAPRLSASLRAGPSRRALPTAVSQRTYSCHAAPSSSTSDAPRQTTTTTTSSSASDSRKPVGHGRVKGRKSPATSFESRKQQSTATLKASSASASPSARLLSFKRSTKGAAPDINAVRQSNGYSQQPPTEIDHTASNHLRNPNAFQGVQLLDSHFALHSSLNPPHMPLPVHLGTRPYTQRIPNHPSTTSLALQHLQSDLASRAFERIRSIAASSTVPRHTKATNLEGYSNNVLGQHLGVSLTLCHPDLAHHLGPSGEAIDLHTRNYAEKERSSPLSTSSHFDQDFSFASAIMSGSTSAPTAADMADAKWEATLAAMDAGLRRFQGKEEEALELKREEGQAAELDEAVLEVEALLKELGLQEKKKASEEPTRFTKRVRERRKVAVSRVRLGQRNVAAQSFPEGRDLGIEMSGEPLSELELWEAHARDSLGGVDAEVTLAMASLRLKQASMMAEEVEAVEEQQSVEDEVHMDSVQRKRRKKISKHKYKKRRKATRAERKRLGK